MQVHQIKTRYSNTYVIEEHGALLVVDVAKRCDGFVIKHIEQKLHLDIMNVQLVTCTHDDADHIGGIVPLARACQAESAIPYASKRTRLKLYRNPLGPFVKVATTVRELFRERSRNMYLSPERDQRYSHVPNLHLDEPGSQRFVLPKYRLTDGKRLKGFLNWEVIHCPGHSWDSVCFFHHPSRSLITGDTLLGSRQKGHLVLPAIYDNPLDKKRTLSKLKLLAPRFVYPGHGSVFSGDNLLQHL